MPNHHFQFKQFTIYQDHCAMKVGTDGVLLGAWTETAQAKHILDVGTGTGLLSLMLAQKSLAGVVALEIDEAASRQARENVERSTWNNRIDVIHQSFREYWENTGEKFDLIISNPPFIVNSLKPPKNEKRIAKHTDTLPFTDLLQGSAALLLPQGRLSVIIPHDQAFDFINKAALSKLYCSRKCHIFPNPHKPAKRMLLELQFQKIKTEETTLYIETGERSQYSEAYKNLTKDYYLAF